MNKQIEEIDKDLTESVYMSGYGLSWAESADIVNNIIQENPNYQKIDEGSVVLTREELIERYLQEHKWASQKTAREIWESFNLFFRPFDKKDAISIDLLLLFLENIVKQYGVEVK